MDNAIIGLSAALSLPCNPTQPKDIDMDNNNTLFAIADGILDVAYEDQRDGTLTSLADIASYAENGMDLIVSESDAMKIQAACLAWLALEDKSANAYYRIVEKPLSETSLSAEAATEIASAAGREAADQGGTKPHLCFDGELNHGAPDWVTALGESDALDAYASAFWAQLAENASYKQASHLDLCDQLQPEHAAGDEAYIVSVEPTGNEPPIRLLWSPANGRAGLSWNADAEWTDAKSPQDAVRRFLTGEMAQ
jgi:hypothetical protein